VKYEIIFENERLIIKESGRNYAVDLKERLLNFAVDILKFLMRLPNRKEYDVIRYQLSKAGTSIGANYEESQAASYAEFKQRIQICLRESKESLFWFKVIGRLEISNDKEYLKELGRLLKEAHEIKLIFGSISNKVHQTLSKKS
jgi:four helix bundle protein